MTDLVERLRANTRPICIEAADEIERLHKFVRWALTEGAWRGGDLNGGDVQDKAASLGLIVKTKYDPAIHGEDDCAEAGDDWFVLAHEGKP